MTLAQRYNDPFDLLRRLIRCPHCQQWNRCYVDDPHANPVCGRCGEDLMAHERSTVADTCTEDLRRDLRGFPLPPPSPPRWWHRLITELNQLCMNGRFRTRQERSAERHRYVAASTVHRALCDLHQQRLDRQAAVERERSLAAENALREATEAAVQEERRRRAAEQERSVREAVAREANRQREESSRIEQEAREAAKRCAAEADRLYDELKNIRYLTGLQFEHFLASVFRVLRCGAEVTRASGDFGVDLIVRSHNEERVAVQAKNVSGRVGNTEVQKLYGGMSIHRCSRSLIVCTSSKYSRSARKAASKLGVTLWGLEDLRRILRGGKLPF